MMAEFKVREFAAIERVTPRTVRQWIAKGALEVRRTPGGHLRIIDRRAIVVTTREPDQTTGEK